MEFVYFVLLGIVQGLTEFLPVSSSGHLVLLNKIFGIQTGNFLFVSIVLHVATLFSVVLFFWKDILEIIKHPFSRKSLLLVIACIPTCIIVLVFKGFFESAFLGSYLSICFMITAILLMLAYFAGKKQKNYCLNNYKKSFLIGVAQGFAVMPGISRSGSTICTGILLGINPEEITSFSFILSIPIIILSLFFEVFNCITQKQILFSGNIFNLIIAFIFSFIFGIIAILFMKKIAKNGRYYIFSVYLVILAIITCFV